MSDERLPKGTSTTSPVARPTSPPSGPSGVAPQGGAGNSGTSSRMPDYQGRSTRELALDRALQYSSVHGGSIEDIIKNADKIAQYLTDGTQNA